MTDSNRSDKSTTKKAATKPACAPGKPDGESAVLATFAAMPEPDRTLGERLHALDQSQRAGAHAETLVRDARVCQGRQGRLLLPKREQVQNQVLDIRLHARGEPRRRRHVADRLRPEGSDRRRRGKDCALVKKAVS